MRLDHHVCTFTLLKFTLMGPFSLPNSLTLLYSSPYPLASILYCPLFSVNLPYFQLSSTSSSFPPFPHFHPSLHLPCLFFLTLSLFPTSRYCITIIIIPSNNPHTIPWIQAVPLTQPNSCIEFNLLPQSNLTVSPLLHSRPKTQPCSSTQLDLSIPVLLNPPTSTPNSPLTSSLICMYIAVDNSPYASPWLYDYNYPL